MINRFALFGCVKTKCLTSIKELCHLTPSDRFYNFSVGIQEIIINIIIIIIIVIITILL